jgi:hemerythrin
MMSAGWDVSMTTGVPLVDNEHKELFRQVENLHRAMREGKGRREIGKILDFVGDYVVSHFAHEEQMMDQYRCPAAEANKAAHNQLIAKFKELQTRFESAGASSSLTLEIHDTLKNWLTQHIHKIDTQLLACMTNAKKEPALAMSK